MELASRSFRKPRTPREGVIWKRKKFSRSGIESNRCASLAAKSAVISLLPSLRKERSRGLVARYVARAFRTRAAQRGALLPKPAHPMIERALIAAAKQWFTRHSAKVK